MALLLLAFVLAARADTITLTDGTRLTGTVARITAGEIIVNGQAPVAGSNASLVVFSAPDVLPYSAGVMLTDGTTLGGAVRSMKPDGVLFRSVALGELTIPTNLVALVYFDAPPAPADVKAPPAGAWQAIFKNGITKDGTLVVLSALSAVLRTADGLEKIPLDQLTRLVRATPATQAAVVLRNRDRFDSPASWNGTNLTVRIGTQTFPIGLNTLREVRWAERNR